jgi:hypothetical protein
MLTSTDSFENENRGICFDFVEVSAVPVPEVTVFVEKGNRAPFTFIVYKLGTLNGLSAVKYPLQV